MPQLPAIDWDDVLAELTSLLREYIRIDTTNPPGNEEPAARFLGDILEREGFACEYLDAGPGRTQLRTRLPGRGGKPPLMLLNHTDVVPAQREFWDVDPFAGVIKDGCIWGRGALDMKGMGILELMVMLLFQRHGLTPDRDLVFLAVADEETGSSMGIEWLDLHRPDWLSEPEFAINEGGMGMLNFLGAHRPVFAVAPAEKGPLWLRLRAQGRPGHGSVPHEDNAVDKLARALVAIQDWAVRGPGSALTVQPLMQAVVDGLGDANAWGGDRPGVDTLAQRHPSFRAALCNTISPTTLGGGVKHNVIPAFAEATLDCRLLPGESHDAFVQQLRGVIDDGGVEVETVMQSESGFSDFQTELVGVMNEVVREQVEGALVLPVTTVGFTDSRVLRRRGVQSYGFVPTLMDSSLAAGIHGHNERIPIDALRTGVQILFEVVRRFTAA
jgi:acetylornithine deacetylase/succinyl-diaminopimelate desuccinylase-like protein